jgi:hypothetical protein
MGTLEIEEKIKDIIKKDNECDVRFEYTTAIEEDVNVEVTAKTFNPKTQEVFLLFKGIGKTSEEAIKKILDYIENHRQNYASHTVVWASKKDMKQQTSYFHSKDAMEALEKFYHGKLREHYVVFNVKLNPMS